VSTYDRRTTPARPDLAAAHLKGQVEAARYAEGRVARAHRGFVPLRAAPSFGAAQETQLLFGERFTVYEDKDGWAWGQIERDSYVAAGDWVSVAERFMGVPYLWGGKTHAGLDCSGLVQTALEAGGILSPRDTDMMEAQLGHAIALDAPVKRGDLIFWKGHVGIAVDSQHLLHANGFFMQVSLEPLDEVKARVQAREGLPIRSIRRL